MPYKFIYRIVIWVSNPIGVDSNFYCNVCGELSPPMYEGHSRINDNEFISRKVLLYSVLFIVPHGDTDITYSCLKFGAFIMARIDAMII